MVSLQTYVTIPQLKGHLNKEGNSPLQTSAEINLKVALNSSVQSSIIPNWLVSEI
jgi:hypothetical protein